MCLLFDYSGEIDPKNIRLSEAMQHITLLKASKIESYRVIFSSLTSQTHSFFPPLKIVPSTPLRSAARTVKLPFSPTVELLPQKDVGVTMEGVGKTCCGKEWVAPASLYFCDDDDTTQMSFSCICKICAIYIATRRAHTHLNDC